MGRAGSGRARGLSAQTAAAPGCAVEGRALRRAPVRAAGCRRGPVQFLCAGVRRRARRACRRGRAPAERGALRARGHGGPQEAGVAGTLWGGLCSVGLTDTACLGATGAHAWKAAGLALVCPQPTQGRGRCAWQPQQALLRSSAGCGGTRQGAGCSGGTHIVREKCLYHSGHCSVRLVHAVWLHGGARSTSLSDRHAGGACEGVRSPAAACAGAR